MTLKVFLAARYSRLPEMLGHAYACALERESMWQIMDTIKTRQLRAEHLQPGDMEDEG